MQNNKMIKAAGKILPGAAVLRNRKKETFCQLYAGNLWGRPGEAWAASMEKVKCSREESRIWGERWLEDTDIRQRVEYLRGIRAKNSIADNAWIKECLVRIASESGKVSDRIRALTNLNRILVLEQQEQKRAERQDDSDFLQMNLPLFEGPRDGTGFWYQDNPVSPDKKTEKAEQKD